MWTSAVDVRKVLGGLDLGPCGIVCRCVWVDTLAEHIDSHGEWHRSALVVRGLCEGG